MRSLFLLVVLAAPLALAGAPSSSEPYLAAGGGPGSWIAACEHELNVGAACFPLEGWERRAYVQLEDDVTFFPVADWYALDSQMLPIAGGTTCYSEAVWPAGASHLVVDFNPTSGWSPIPECQSAVSGTVRVRFG